MPETEEPLPHLATFVKAAELSSFTAAAKALHLSQPAVSQRVQQLETMLKTGLFERNAGRIMLTDAGRLLYDYAVRILELDQEARVSIGANQVPLTGDLLLGASSIPGDYLLPNLILGFQGAQPAVRVRVLVSNSTQAAYQVERGEVNLAVIGTRINRPHLILEHMTNDRLVAVTPPKHPLARRRCLSLRELTKFPLVVREAGSGMRCSLEAMFEASGRRLSSANIVLELGSNEAIKEAVARGAGIAVLSELAVRNERLAGTLRTTLIDDRHSVRHIFSVRDDRRVLPKPARLFCHHIKRMLGPSTQT